jgi:hypothetical protein
MIKQTALGEPKPNAWRELGMFGPLNDFEWELSAGTSVDAQGQFLKGGCGDYDPQDDAIRDKIEMRHGLYMRRLAMDANPNLDQKSREQCEKGFAPGDPRIEKCGYVWTEWYIPTSGPTNWCAKATKSIRERWFPSGTTKIPTLEEPRYKELQTQALKRVNADPNPSPVSKAEWDRLTGDLPRICQRAMGGPDGKRNLGVDSVWRPAAKMGHVLGAVWCDY